MLNSSDDHLVENSVSPLNILLTLYLKPFFFHILGKLYTENIYCKVYLGKQEQQTDIGKDNSSNGNGPQNGFPQIPTLVWNCSMQFHVSSIKSDVLTVIVYEMCPFKPDSK